MELHIVSNVEQINTSAQQIYFVLQHFRNFAQLPPNTKNVNNFKVDNDTLSFNYRNMLHVGMRIIDREELKTIKIVSEGRNPFDYFIWIQLVEKSYNDTRLRITMKAEMSFMKRLFFKRFLQKMLNNFNAQIAQSFNMRFS